MPGRTLAITSRHTLGFTLVRGWMHLQHLISFLVGTDIDENETQPPKPNAMGWKKQPYAIDHQSIAMLAKTAHDLSGVEYYFKCTYGGGHDSGWQTEPYYIDTNLSTEQIYTYTVTVRDNSNNYNQTFSSIPASCILEDVPVLVFWNFEDGTDGQDFTASGQTNESGGSYDTEHNIFMCGYSSTTGPSWSSFTIDGNGLSMNCADSSEYSYIKGSPYLNAWSPSAWTIECAVYLEDISGWETIIGRDGSTDGDNESDFYLQKNDIDDKFRININTAGGERWILDGNYTAKAYNWYRLAITSDGITLKMYLNDNNSGYQEIGSLDISSQTVAENALAATDFLWTFGRGWYNGSQVDYIDGFIDDVRFSTQALTIDQLLGANSGTSPWTYGDFTGDNNIDMSDFSVFSQLVLNRSLNSLDGFDLNNDNMITMPEFIQFAENWLNQ